MMAIAMYPPPLLSQTLELKGSDKMTAWQSSDFQAFLISDQSFGFTFSRTSFVMPFCLIVSQVVR